MKKRACFNVICGCLLCAVTLLASPVKVSAAMSQADRKAYQAVFDADYYYDTYADVAAVIGKDKNALFNHFLNYGIAEGRSASASFNPKAYKYRYADLQSAFGGDIAAYCRHYINYGIAEGRDASDDGTTMERCASEIPKGKRIGTYTTYYKKAIPRAVNVELAAQRINGVVVQPEGEFSFSQTILPRTAENGYVVAPIFLNKQISKGIGGGICQVSSTLYAAMLSADFPATERHPHSLPVDYLPEGMDATISGNVLDLKFKNTYSQSLKIYASAESGNLTVSLYLVD